MKKLINIGAIIISLSLFSCTDFLDEDPKSFVSPDQFYQSDVEANAGAIGCYHNVTKLFGGQPGIDGLQWDLNYFLHYGTDIARPTGGREAQYPFHVYNLSVATEGAIPDLWRVFYRGVADANNLIDKVMNSKNTTESIRKQIVAEGLFYRAFYYYYLTSLWGDVPYIDRFDINYSISGLPRTSCSEIRKNMISDLEASANDLPDNSADNYKGRPTRWAAKMLLSKFYLWEKEWAKVSSTCEEIISQSSHRLLNSYDDLWGEEHEYNEESIWELDFVQHIFRQHRTTQMCPRGVDETSTDPALSSIFTGYGLLTATPEFITTFDQHDARIIWYKWLDGDDRVNFIFNYVAKFLDKPENMIRGNSGINVLIYRLADAYLMQAEAENELNNGPTAKAYDRINTIRERANLLPLAGRSKDQFFSDIINERKWELAFEYHRKIDLCRWNKLVEVVHTMGGSNPDGAKHVQQHHQLFPIPSKEMMKNKNLTQNPGY
ncbi:MAG: RagB/SusD family nutrient uptake outer membrane protein [Tannerella sp.]|nr:RagB/SusD family nutrient uptake outer membrane protein [Tannerella sp.]